MFEFIIITYVFNPVIRLNLLFFLEKYTMYKKIKYTLNVRRETYVFQSV